MDKTKSISASPLRRPVSTRAATCALLAMAMAMLVVASCSDDETQGVGPTTTSSTGGTAGSTSTGTGGGGATGGSGGAPGPIGLDSWTYIQVSDQHVRVFGLAFGDVTGDGQSDIVSGPFLYVNPGGDMSGAWQQIDMGQADALWVIDVDGDAFADVLAYDGSGLHWLEADDAQGSSWSATTVGTAHGADHNISSQGYRAGQLVAGGNPELLLSTDSWLLFYEIPSASPETCCWSDTVLGDSQGEGVDIGDIDGDGANDVLARMGTTGVAWWRNPGSSGSWTSYAIGDVDIGTDRIALADLNGDGRLDAVATDENGVDSGAGTYWFEQPADPTSSPWARQIIATQATTNAMAVADMDRDGDVDVITGEHRGTEKVIIWENDGSGSFTPHEVDEGKESHLGVQPVDLDGDGDLDLVSIAWDDSQFVHLWRNDNG